VIIENDKIKTAKADRKLKILQSENNSFSWLSFEDNILKEIILVVYGFFRKRQWFYNSYLNRHR